MNSLSKEHLQAILGKVQDGLIVLNDEGHIQTVNEATVRIFGVTSENMLIGKHLRHLFANQADSIDVLLLPPDSEHMANRESSFKKEDGQLIIGSYSVHVTKHSNQTESIRYIFIHDITDRRRTEQKLDEYMTKLEKKNKELDQFAYIISHDLKAPLRAISNLSTWIQDDLGTNLDDDTKKNLEMMRGRVSRMEALITGVLEYSKIGRQQAQAEPVDIFLLLTEALEMLGPPPQIKIEIGDMPTIMVPKVMLSQIFSNLISNAIKYNDKSEGHITINADETKDNYKFTVADNGPGIAPEFHEKIFVIFQTLQSRDRFESTGIGLTIVTRILEQLGGTVHVESEVGKGSKFIFQLPKSRVLIPTFDQPEPRQI